MTHRSSRHLLARLPRTRLHLLGAALIALVGLGLLLSAAGCTGKSGASQPAKRVFVFGVDGMDYTTTQRLMDEGRMPNFAKLAQKGGFDPLGTSVPPLSPVAWSNFITGMDSGGHGIFDFLHRSPDRILPEFSTSKAIPPEDELELGCWKIPLGAGKIENLRQGEAFWDILEENGIETSILRMPANFPPTGTASRELSGMGTPDIHGTYGLFSFYTSVLFAADRDVDGGDIFEVWEEDGVVKGTLEGPKNPFQLDDKEKGCKAKNIEVDFKVYVDAETGVTKLVIGDEERVLAVGEWSDWIPIQFDLLPKFPYGPGALPGMVRFYLRSIRPEFELYASPINYDPFAPAAEISSPADYAADLAKASGGRFYTQGMPEDTQALSQEVLSRDEFIAQADLAGHDVMAQLDYVLDEFMGAGDGLAFYYTGNIDLVSHMMWRAMDPEHPAYDPETDPAFARHLEQMYVDIDTTVGHIAERVGDDTTLIVMSDHGFAPWRRSFNLNSWLRDNGYLVVKDPKRKDPGYYLNVDWTRTRAYGLGFNGLYVNLKDREAQGIVDPADRDELLAEIAEKLLAYVDPKTGQPAVTKMYRREEIYQDRGALEIGPDMQVGYTWGTRSSSESSLGSVLPEIMSDHMEEWSGDHSMDHETVPGILLTNRPLRKPAADLKQLSSSVVAEFGLDGFPRHRTEAP